MDDLPARKVSRVQLYTLDQPTLELRCLPVGKPGFFGVLLADAIPQFPRLMGKAHDMIL
ncbi:hypothetical protein [Paracoccus spongiarum]|uniref:Uncharacterized protein n=1 Tax=Paracoccus spongiarum TaxID=3064387 RepID=A0ABT9JGB6_9RHOB|nr:hypothetical protein [Paracoccus sp. 2205BS29-5]MDP5308877.1 hypothetical protein [Paracoccus sp. 2205BS29-5]